MQGTLNLPRPEDRADALSAYWEQVGGKTPRYYQMIAINRVVNAVLGGQKRILLTMATGTGKTFVAFQTAWRLWKAGRKKRILFLAYRNVLIVQAKDRTFVPMGQALHKLQGKVSALRTADLPRKIYPSKMRVERPKKEQLSDETTKTRTNRNLASPS